MPPRLLTAAFIDTVTATRRTAYYDTHARGLALRVSPSGAKTWAYVYRVRGGGPARWLTLGQADTLTLAKARALVAGHRYAVEVERRDLVAERQAARAPQPAVFTFGDMVPVYLAFQRGRKRTWKDDRQKIAKHLAPAWDPLPLRDITRRHVHERLDALVGQGMTVGVNRIQALISRIFTVALDRSLIDTHPCVRMIKRFDEANFARDRVLSDDELRTLWAGLDAHPGALADAVRLRALTGQRMRQIRLMEWPHLDLLAGLWTIPRADMKKNRTHVVPLAPAAWALLRRRRTEAAPSQLRVFCLDPNTADFRAVAALRDGFRWLDLRRTMDTRLAALKVPEEVRKALLSHAKGSVEAIHYNQYEFLDEKRDALVRWDRELQQVVGHALPPEDRRVRLRRALGVGPLQIVRLSGRVGYDGAAMSGR